MENFIDSIGRYYGALRAKILLVGRGHLCLYELLNYYSLSLREVATTDGRSEWRMDLNGQILLKPETAKVVGLGSIPRRNPYLQVTIV